MTRIAVVLLLTVCARAAVLPAGTRLEIRLKTRVASNLSKPKDPVEAVLIHPVVIAGAVAVPAGVTLAGAIGRAVPIAKPEDRATLELAFTRIVDAKGHETPVETKLVDVDNARESVEPPSRIVGILGSETLAARMDQGVARVQEKYAKLGGFLQTLKSGVFREPQPEIDYEPGVELSLELLKPVEWSGAGPQAAEPAAMEPAEEVFSLVNSQPFQTATEGQAVPSDLTNLMFIGSEKALQEAFKAAGWATAAQLSGSSKLEVVRAVAESRGYKEAPMSILTLDGKKPDLVFQKQNNTFAMRHHLRIFRRPATFQGRDVWVCAATHDTGIELSAEKRTFIHKIDSEIDRERAKVVGDLVFAGRVKALSLVARPAVPTASQNATGDKLATDGAMAVLVIE